MKPVAIGLIKYESDQKARKGSALGLMYELSSDNEKFIRATKQTWNTTQRGEDLTFEALSSGLE